MLAVFGHASCWTPSLSFDHLHEFTVHCTLATAMLRCKLLVHTCCCRVREASNVLWPVLPDIWSVRYHWEPSQAGTVCGLLDPAQLQGKPYSSRFTLDVAQNALPIYATVSRGHPGLSWVGGLYAEGAFQQHHTQNRSPESPLASA